MGYRGRGGSRGGSRGGGRGRGRFRGRGSRGRGGRGGFTNARVADNDQDVSTSEEEESDVDLEDAAFDSEDDAPAATSYTALLQSLKEDAPSAKKRKLNTSQAQPSNVTEPEDTDSDDHEAESNDENESGSQAAPRDPDFVDEEEEDLENAFADEIYDDEEEEDAEDPFDRHFCIPDDTSIAPRVQQVKANNWAIKRSATKMSRVVTTYLEGTDAPTATRLSGPSVLKLKPKLQETAMAKFPNFNPAQSELAPHLFNYRDILYCQRTVQNSEGLRNLVCLHALNHVFKTRDRVIKNNQRLSQKKEETEMECRDQGFTRPKVLFIVPTRQSCVRIIDTIVALTEPDQQENRKRFDDGYLDKDAKFSDDKPADFQYLFEGNDDDMFRIGVKFTRKTIKYFSQFYNSDILVASPLGLRMAIGSEDDDKKKIDYDFLSSIELVVLDQADGLLMQNWEHVEQICENLNKQPKDAHGCDFSRVRSWYLEDWARYFRQTVVLSAFNTPELAELMRVYCHNTAGKLRIQPDYQGVLQQLGVKVRQTFVRFDPKSVDKDPDARFEYFKSTIVPLLVKRAKDAVGTLIFIPSYLDFVRVRNFLANDDSVQSLTFGTISEYADVPEASRARSHFLSGRHRVLLYTERAHHFRRYRIRGVQRVIMYAPPDNPVFYKEITGDYFMRSEQDHKLVPGTATVRVMFSKYDAFRLERIAGSVRVGKMLTDRGDTFDFV